MTQQTKTLAVKSEANSNTASAPVLARPTTEAPAKPAIPAAAKPAPKIAAPKKAEKKAKKIAAKPAAKKFTSPYAKNQAAKPAAAFKEVHSAFPPQFPAGVSNLAGSLQETFAKLFPASAGFDKLFTESTRDFSKTQRQVFDIGSEGIASIAKNSEKAADQLNEAINASRDTIEAVIECGNIATTLSKSIGNKLTELANDITAQNVNAAQQFLSCRTASDILNLQNDYIRSNVDNAFNNSLKIAELIAQFAKVAEPINERIANATEKFARKARK